MKVLFTYSSIKRKMIFACLFLCINNPIKVIGQNDSIGLTQLKKVKQEILGTWIYQKTLFNDSTATNKVDSFRIIIFQKRKVTIKTIFDRKLNTKTLKYQIYKDSIENIILDFLPTTTKNSRSEWGKFILKKIKNDTLLIVPYYYPEYDFFYIKQKQNKLTRKERKRNKVIHDFWGREF